MTRAPTLTQWCERYLEVRADDLSEGTAALVRAARDQFVAFLRGDPRIDRIDAAMANDWRTWLGKQPNKRRPNRRLSPYTVAMYVSRMRAVFALAVEERRIPANPFARVRVRTPEPEEDWQDVTHADLERILAACPDDGWRCLFALCRLAGTRSGMRGGEALDLTWPDVDWQAGTIRVTDQKTGGKRTVPIIGERLRQVLREAFERAENRDGYVCGSVSRSNLDRDAKAIIQAAGLPVYSKPFHTLRKCLETEWIEADPPLASIPTICKWLGNSPEVMMRHYHRRTLRAETARAARSAQHSESVQAHGRVSSSIASSNSRP